MWLNGNDEFILDGELARVTEESLGDSRGFIESRDQKHVCAACCNGQSSSPFPTSDHESSPRMQMDRGEVDDRRGEANEREKSFGPHHRQRERRIRSHAYSVAQLVQFMRERTCETLPQMSNK